MTNCPHCAPRLARRRSDGLAGINFPARKVATRRFLGGFFQRRLVELVIQRLEADSELFGGVGLVAAVTIERVVDGLHFEVAEGDRPADAALGQRAAATGKSLRQMIGRDRSARGRIAKYGRMLD